MDGCARIREDDEHFRRCKCRQLTQGTQTATPDGLGTMCVPRFGTEPGTRPADGWLLPPS